MFEGMLFQPQDAQSKDKNHRSLDSSRITDPKTLRESQIRSLENHRSEDSRESQIRRLLNHISEDSRITDLKTQESQIQRLKNHRSEDSRITDPKTQGSQIRAVKQIQQNYVVVGVSFGEVNYGGVKNSHKALPRRMSILKGAVLRRRHDEVLDGDLVELSKGFRLRHRRHVIQAKPEAKLLQIRSLR